MTENAIIFTKESLEEHDAKIRADEREKTIDAVIKRLAMSEDTILSDAQYYTLMELKNK